MRPEMSPRRLSVVADLLILTARNGRLTLLLSRRTAPPLEGCWALPERFIRADESAETAVRILLDGFLPVPEAKIEQLYTFTDPDRDPRGRVVSVAYLAILSPSRLDAAPADGASPLLPFSVGLDAGGLRLTGMDGAALTSGDLAFDHGRIIETGVERLRNKIDYTDIGFAFLENPRAFSLSDLQDVFESVHGHRLDGSNFRRAILNRYGRTGRLRQTELTDRRSRGRPATLYRLDP